MICPKCGTAIKDGYLYCSKCGEEVIMVPDFEIELEEGIEQTISEVAEMMADSVEDLNSREVNDQEIIEESDIAVDVSIEPVPEKEGSIKDKVKRAGPGILVITAVILGLFFVYGIVRLVSALNDYYSYETQLKKAQSEFEERDYDEAVRTARHVMSLEPKDVQSRLLIADSYSAMEKYDESIAVLEDLVEDFPQDKGIYERLLKNYEIEGDMESIIRLSEKSIDPEISALFEGYALQIPEFSIDSGTYYERQELSITSSGDGTIYYTIDKTQPTASSILYETPIILEEGETTVTAVCINNKGIAGEPVSKTYYIEAAEAVIPELLTEPGEYSIAQLIKLSETEDGTLHYTTDGSEPTADSKEYEPPVPMPLGKSEFKFAIVYDSGTTSDVVTAEYTLSIKGVYDASYAQNAVQLRLIALGHPVMDHEFVAKYGYSQDGRNYYIVEEYVVTDGKKNKQGTLFAVDSQTGEVFTIVRNTKKGDYDFGVVT